MDALHGVEYATAQQEIYEKTNKGIYGSPGTANFSTNSMFWLWLSS